jgi:hypothetical protein
MKRLAIGILAVMSTFVLTGCAGSLVSKTTNSETSANSGVRGTVQLETTGGAPPRDGIPRMTITPLPQILVTIEPSSKSNTTPAFTATSDANGKFEIALSPGEYVITLPAKSEFPTSASLTTNVTVKESAFTTTTLHYSVALP